MENISLNGKTLLFLHIPKTAGNSFFNVMRRQYPSSRRYELNMDWDHRQKDIDNFVSLDDDKKRNVSYIGGHIHYGFHRFIPQPSVYVTFVRNPVDRFISHYYFIKNSNFEILKMKLESIANPTAYESNALSFLRLTENSRNTLEDFLDLNIDLGTINLQTRMIGGFIDPANITPPFDSLPSEAVQIAKNNIKSDFPVVGLVENFDESLLLLRKVFGWTNIFYVTHNKTRSRLTVDQVNSKTRKRIESECKLDIELYDMIRTRFYEQILHFEDDFTKQLTLYRAGRRCYSFLHRCYNITGIKKLRR